MFCTLLGKPQFVRRWCIFVHIILQLGNYANYKNVILWEVLAHYNPTDGGKTNCLHCDSF